MFGILYFIKIFKKLKCIQMFRKKFLKKKKKSGLGLDLRLLNNSDLNFSK